jgi:hypothetical protein
LCAGLASRGLPLIDDDGYGSALSTIRTVQEYVRNGVAGIHIEDQAFPKRPLFEKRPHDRNHFHIKRHYGALASKVCGASPNPEAASHGLQACSVDALMNIDVPETGSTWTAI